MKSIVYISACRYVSYLAPHSLMGIRAVALTYGLSRHESRHRRVTGAALSHKHKY